MTIFYHVPERNYIFKIKILNGIECFFIIVALPYPISYTTNYSTSSTF